eukprot:307730_1
MDTIQIPTYQPITYRRDNTFNNQSSQEELQILLSAITQWRLKYDPNDELFPDIWHHENQKFKSQFQLSSDSKEEELQFINSTSNTENNGKFPTYDESNNSNDLDFDPTEDTETWNEMKKINEQNLNKNQRLNKQAKEFIPSSQRLDIIDELTILQNKTTNRTNIIINTEQTEPKTCTQKTFNQYNIQNAATINTLNVNMIHIPQAPIVQSKTANQFHTVHTQLTQHGNDDNIKTEFKNNEYSDHSYSSGVVRRNNIDEIFEPKFNSHAKCRFFIEKNMTIKMMQKCAETFHTHKLNDDNAAFGYYKESVAMQINDKQIKIIRTRKCDIVILNIDLHYENGDIMYLIAIENDIAYKKRVKWKIVDFMSAYEIKCVYNVNNAKLPKSSRNMPHFKYAMRNPPVQVPFNVINETNFKGLPCKDPNKKPNKMLLSKIRISESDLKYYCHQSWNNSIMVPVVVVKGKKQWIEWKKFIRIYDQYHNKYQWFGVSLRYYPSNRQWKIECMDYDFGRMYYQYKLVGTNHNYCYKYNDLIGFVTTSLDIQ